MAVAARLLARICPMPFHQALRAIAMAAVSAGATAQTPTPTTQLEPVVVQGNYNNSIGSSDAASQGTVTSKLIENRPTLRPAEVLEFVPGVIVSQHSGDGKANQYYLRGFNLDHGTDFATFVDAMPVNMPTHAHGHGYSDLNWLIPELVDRIDYRKGPYYAEEGDFASAGAAHIRLVDTLPKGIGSITFGENGYRRGAAGELRRPGRGAVALRAGGRTQRRALGQPRELPPPERRVALQLRRRPDAVRDHRHGLFGPVELHGPDPEACRRPGPDRALRCARSHRRRRDIALPPLIRPDAPARRRRLQVQCLCHPVALEPVLQLHLLPREPGGPGPDRGERRPIRAGGAPQSGGADHQPELEHQRRWS